MDIRPERPGDYAAIAQVTKAAFAPMPYSQGDEAECVAKLRSDGDLTLSLVADSGADLLGHIAFSPVFFDAAFTGWYGLGPVSVAPHAQRQGLGGTLVTHGLADIARRGAQGCVLIGDPRYYSRFGFVSDNTLSYRNLPRHVVQYLAFGAARPSGVLTFSPGLEG
ncbi:MAG: N-acetyltransferase [Hyphomonadaceae bacterium]|nr:N-acetyltransferase [Hyphomonadaceae bacterium]